MEKKIATAKETRTFDLAVVGRLLREAREGKGLAVDEVSKALFLRKSVIHALESGTWDKLPHLVYVKGHITQYASYLKVYHEILPLLTPGQEKTGDAPETSSEAPPVKLRAGERPDKLSKPAVGRTIVYAVVAVFLVGFFVIKNMERPVSEKPSYENVARSSYESKSPQTVQGSVIFEQKKLMIACHERTWLRIVIDETEKKEFMLNPQEMVVFTGKEGFDLLVGNAGGVKLYYNGNETNFSGESGQVKRVKLP